MFFSREEPFIPYLDSLPSLQRNLDGPFMMPIVDKYADMGTVVIGKVESGHCFKGQTLAIYPNRQEVKVDQVSSFYNISRQGELWSTLYLFFFFV
jgi:peptide chain release factor subunit 3